MTSEEIKEAQDLINKIELATTRLVNSRLEGDDLNARRAEQGLISLSFGCEQFLSFIVKKYENHLQQHHSN